MRKEFTTGRIGESIFIRKIERLGHKIEDHRKGKLFDFIVNGLRVEVKTSKLSKVGSWCFDFTKNLGAFDVLACCGIHQGKTYWFIIPAFALDEMTALQLRPFTPLEGWAHWSQFLEQWDFLGIV